ncbi:MAG: DUF1552 domain-containing protein [Candidatus Latescibacteria bacterium]|nr:DUF1552 domain-containing protein [Candidatus Latescibacterota bacterium]
MTDATTRSIPRRQFLRGTGVLLSLPFLSSLLPRAALAASAVKPESAPPRRMLGICNNLGLLNEQFFPQQAGRGYDPSPYLQILEAHRDDFTVLSGTSHPGVDGGHPADVCFLTAAPHPGSGGFRNTVSLDQYIAERIGTRTRFPSLTLGVNTSSSSTLSFTGTGVGIPPEDSPSAVFRKMFVQGSAEEVAEQMHKLNLGGSILDTVAGQAKDLLRRIGTDDRERLDQYFTSVRQLEQHLASAREWETKPKPVVEVPIPEDPSSPREYMAKVKAMYDIARLAFETDSTRSISLMLDGVNSPAINIEGVHISDGYHNLSHHGQSEDKIAQLKAIDEWHMRLLNDLLAELSSVQEAGESLLDRTMIVYGSNLGNANTHSTTNLPVFLAGGGFRHGQHLAFDRERNYPLTNLFVSMLQRLDIETDRFASSTGTMRGLEMT